MELNRQRRPLRAIACCFLLLLTTVPLKAHAVSYSQACKRATRETKLYDANTFEAKIIWSATMFTDAFREQYIERHIEVNRLDPAEAAAWSAEQKRTQSSVWEFFVSMYARRSHQEFSNDEESFWKIKLVDAQGSEVKPIAIELINTSPYVRVMFPHVNRWAKTYRVTFPKVALGAHPELIMHSVIGTSTLEW